MLIKNYLNIILLIRNQFAFLIIISLIYGWSIINLTKYIKNKYFFKFNKLNQKYIFDYLKIKKYISSFLLGLIKLQYADLYFKGISTKLMLFKNMLQYRTGFSNKLLINPMTNLKYVLIKKSILIIKNRFINIIKMYFNKLKKKSNTSTYKKIGIYIKNQLIFIKKGKLTKK